MRTFLYIIWFLFPLAFFVMALWAGLEKVSNRQKKENPGDFLKQGTFVLVCVLISILLDQFALDSVMQTVIGDYLPLGFLQVMLLPVVLYIGAKVLGPTKSILISKAPRPTQVRGARKR